MQLGQAVRVLVMGAAGVVGCAAAPEEPAGRSSTAIVGGVADTADTGVVALVQKSTGTLCSGVVVAPEIVLTAAHCVYGVSPADLQVLVGPDETNPALTAAVASVAVYPTYAGESEGLPGGVDLAAVTTTVSLPVAPATVRTDVTDAELQGATVTLVGYGVDSTTDPASAGTRRCVQAPVDGVCSRLLTAGDADANACNGDSGGAVLLGSVVVAITSGGSSDCSAPSSHTRLSAHAEWVASVVAGTAGAACAGCVTPDPSCTATVEGASTGSGEDGGASDGGDAGGSGGGHAGGGGCSASGAGGAGDLGAGIVALAAAVLARRRRPARPTTRS